MMQRRGPCSAMDKLILAAMMEDSATVAAAAAMAHAQNPAQAGQHHHHHLHNPQAMQQNGYMPSGRGIGYLHMREPAMEVPTPSNKSELELYRLLERANLLSYFGIFLNFGGDDVQQLSDADEEEFLEIMSLVGMTQKPLHVRRFQKALIEWRESKELDSCFKIPINHNSSATISSKEEFTSSSSASTVHCNDNNSRQHQQLSPDPSILVESPATTPNSFKSMTTTMTSPSKNTSFVGQQHYALPHEALIGAPKRLRLMDNMLQKSPNNEQGGQLKQSDEEHPRQQQDQS